MNTYQVRSDGKDGRQERVLITGLTLAEARKFAQLAEHGGHQFVIVTPDAAA